MPDESQIKFGASLVGRLVRTDLSPAHGLQPIFEGVSNSLHSIDDTRRASGKITIWVVRDNKWRATRYGLDAIVITDDTGNTAPLRDELYELIRELEPAADRLGCAEELKVASDVLDQGAPYERQRAISAEGANITKLLCSATGGQPEAACK